MKPTVGRIVHVYTRQPERQSNGIGEGPYAAIVTRMFSDECINATVLPPFAPQYETASILHRDASPIGNPNWWEWPAVQQVDKLTISFEVDATEVRKILELIRVEVAAVAKPHG